MSSFNFDDYEDAGAAPAFQPPRNETSKNKSFNFDDFEDVDQGLQENQTNVPSSVSQGPYAVKELSAEELRKLPFDQKLEYARDLETNRQYRHSKELGKEALSGASFGFSEEVPGLKPSGEEGPVSAIGQGIGAIAPILAITALTGGAGLPAVLARLSPGVGRFLHGAITGALYGSAKQGANAARGKEVNLTDIPKEAALFGTFSYVGGKIADQFAKFSPSNQASILEEGIIPKDLPKSQYETAEKMLDLIKKPGTPPPPPPGGGPPPPPGGAPTPLRPERITKPEDIGLRPPTTQPYDIENKVGSIFSENRFYNTTEGGKALKAEIRNIDEDVYRGVSDLYNTSRELHGNIEEIHPRLVNDLENRLESLRKIPEPSDVQKRLIRASENILEDLAEFNSLKDETGNVIGKEIAGFKPINNQTLIDQIQSLRQIVDYDFSHGNTKNIFKPLINDLQDSVIRAAEYSGNPEAVESFNAARAGYRAWTETFDTPYVRPWRSASDQDYSKLFKSSLDLDESNVLKNILDLSEKGQQLQKASVRQIVDKNLDPYFKNPGNYKSKDFDKALRELEAVITPEQATEVRSQFKEAAKENPQPRPISRGRVKTKELSDVEKRAAKYLGKEPEDLLSRMDKRSGIKEIREDFSNDNQGKKLFEQLEKQKVRSILREGNIEPDFTGDQMYKFLNKEKNYEILSEILGESETENLRVAAREIGKKQVKSELRRQSRSKALNKLAVYKTIELILSVF